MQYAMENTSRKWDFNCYKSKKRTLYKIYTDHFKNNFIGFGDYSRSDDCMIKLRRPPIKEFKQFLLTNQTVIYLGNRRVQYIEIMPSMLWSDAGL